MRILEVLPEDSIGLGLITEELLITDNAPGPEEIEQALRRRMN